MPRPRRRALAGWPVGPPAPSCSRPVTGCAPSSRRTRGRTPPASSARGPARRDRPRDRRRHPARRTDGRAVRPLDTGTASETRASAGYAFGPTKVSRMATPSRCATDTWYFVHGRQRTPRRSQTSVNSFRISSDRFENWYRGYCVVLAFGPDAVDSTPAVTVDQTTEKGARLRADDLVLPGPQFDLPRVLAAGTVLGEVTAPLLPRRVDAQTTPSEQIRPRPRSPTADRLDRITAITDDRRVPLVQRDSEHPRVPHSAEVTITQVHAEQVRIRAGGNVFKRVNVGTASSAAWDWVENPLHAFRNAAAAP